MGNTTVKNSQVQVPEILKFNMTNKFTPPSEFKFMEPFEEDSTNGLYLNGIYLPEELISNILSYVPPKSLLRLTLVCKMWCNIIKSETFWMNIYKRRCRSKAKKLPWYVYYCYFTTDNFNNLIKNGNGQDQFRHWKIIRNFGDKFRIENPPCGSDPLPEGVPEFYGHGSCFATSYSECNKIQEIFLTKKRLLRYILCKFRPYIYASEWMAGRFDCGCVYKLTLRAYGEDYKNLHVGNFRGDEEVPNPLFCEIAPITIQQWDGSKWEKVEIVIKDYPPDIAVLIFEHEGQDTQFWKGHYGSKMAGGVLRVVFDSINPLEDNL